MPELTMKPVTSFEVIDHGIQHDQYFQGCGISFTQFTAIATGIGNDAAEAFEDALEQLASNGWDVSTLEEFGSGDLGTAAVSALAANANDHDNYDSHYYHVSIRVY